MAGSLVLLHTQTASASSSIDLGGNTYWDNSYDVYVYQYINVHTSVDGATLNHRFLVSGTADTSSNYDSAEVLLTSGSAFAYEGRTNGTAISTHRIGTATNESANGMWYLFNFNNSSEYSFCTYENTTIENTTGTLRGKQGGGTLTVAQATNGLSIYTSSGNIASGKFKLYGLKK